MESLCSRVLTCTCNYVVVVVIRVCIIVRSVNQLCRVRLSIRMYQHGWRADFREKWYLGLMQMSRNSKFGWSLTKISDTTVLLILFSTQNFWKIVLLFFIVEVRRGGPGLKEYTAFPTAEDLWGSSVPHVLHLKVVTGTWTREACLCARRTGYATNSAACLIRDFSIRIAILLGSDIVRCG